MNWNSATKKIIERYSIILYNNTWQKLDQSIRQEWKWRHLNLRPLWKWIQNTSCMYLSTTSPEIIVAVGSFCGQNISWELLGIATILVTILWMVAKSCTSWWVVYPIIYRVSICFNHPTWCKISRPSTVGSLKRDITARLLGWLIFCLGLRAQDGWEILVFIRQILSILVLRHIWLGNHLS